MSSVAGAVGIALAMGAPPALGVQTAAGAGVPPGALAVQAADDAAPSDPARERIYGSVRTTDGRRLEGYLRWDRNETHWADFLDGRREISPEREREAERLDAELGARRARERSITLSTVRITWDEDDGVPPETTAAAVRFAHLMSLEVAGPRRAVVVLTSGDTLELVAGSSDLGGGFRGLVIEGDAVDDVELDWDELERVDFVSAPTGHAPPRSRRLYGTVFTQGGLELTGLVAWDLDEALTTDVLDGEQGRENIRIPFGDITAIARESDSSARITRTNGAELVLEDTNDVDSSNRGIEVTNAEFGRVIVDWDDFARVRFHEPTTSSAGRDLFTAGGRLRGTVAGADGTRASGFVRWDIAEEHGWDVLDASRGALRFTVELARVLSIAKGAAGARVTLVDGRVLEVDTDEEDSGDFREGNRGVFVQSASTASGETVMVPWRDFLTMTLTWTLER